MASKPLAAIAALMLALASWAPAQGQPVEKQRGPGDNQNQTAPAPSGKNQLAPFNPKKNQPTPAAANPAPTKSDDNQSADKLGDALTGTQDYLERRWLLWRLRVLADTVKAAELDALLKADAQRIGIKGPSPDDAKQLDADLAGAIDVFLDGVESRIRNKQAQWPADKPPLDYANASLVMLETVRLEAVEARKNKGDLLLGMRRADRIVNLTKGGGSEDHFAGRDEAVDAAMKSVALSTPPPPKR